MHDDELIRKDFGTLAELIRLHARQQPAHAAIVLHERTLDYATLDAEMDRVAASLQRDGLRPGDAIAICARNSLEYAAVFLGASRAGVTVAPLAPDTSPEGLARMVADANAAMIFFDTSVTSSLEQVAARVTARRIKLDGPDLRSWLLPAGAVPRAVKVEPQTVFNLIYSSGTTGVPKGIAVPYSFRWAQLQVFTTLGYGSDTVSLLAITLYSNMALSAFLPALGMGATVVLMAKFDAGLYLELAQRHRATHSMLVPIQVQRIMRHPDFERFDLSSFRVKSCASEPFPAALKADVLARWPGELFEYYGMTEGGGVCVLDARQHPDKLHTVGHPLPGHDMRVIDEHGRELPTGEAGEIVGRSPTMMVGYHNQPEKTAEAEWFDDQGRRFIRTGDGGRFDADGYLILLDRKKDMIISGGFNIYPSDIESVMRTHPDVAEVAVVGVPSDRWGETPVAFVVPRAGAGPSGDALREWTNERVGKPQRLAALEIVDSLPRSDIGKVLKRSLRDAWLATGRRL